MIDSTSRQPIEGVAISGAPNRVAVLTDALGRFRLTGVAPNTDQIKLRRIGYAPRTIGLRPPADRSATVELDTILMQANAVALDSLNVLVESDRNSPWLSGFYRRKSTGAGRYLTRADIVRQKPSKVSDVLRMTPGVTVRCRARGFGCSVSTRAGSSFCLDGMKIAGLEIDEVPVDQIVAIETYDSSIWAPPGYRGCVILLWSEPPG